MFNRQIYRTIWLRHVLREYRPCTTFSKLRKRNRFLRVEIKPAKITEAHEALYALYKSSIDFEVSASIDQLLNGYVYESVQLFNTYEVNLFDGDAMIGCSYFDLGKKSAQGISAFFDPAYRAGSPGRYMIFLQIEFCKQQGFDYYYPGYFVPGYPHLDYKLGIAPHCLEFLNIDDACWYPMAEFSERDMSERFLG